MNMRVLVGIANFGNKNDKYLKILLDEYFSMKDFNIKIAVFSDKKKVFKHDVEVIVGLPSKNPWSLPFAHKKVFAERVNEYDLFIYSEDDTFIQEKNIKAFISATKLLPEDKIAGFLRFEKYSENEIFYTTVHSYFHWDIESVFSIEPYTFARFTNDHSACYILTRKQLRAAVMSGGYLKKPVEGQYDLLCTAATDPYTSCGFQKVIPISHLVNFSLHHLPNVYENKMGIPELEMSVQIDALLKISNNLESKESMMFTNNSLLPPMFRKTYYEFVDMDILDLTNSAHNILTIGCSYAITEKELVRRGKNVYGIPIDNVMGSIAKLNGVKTYSPNVNLSLKLIGNKKFDCIIINDFLQYCENPLEIILQLKNCLESNGTIIIKSQNHSHFSTWRYLFTYDKKLFFKNIKLFKYLQINRMYISGIKTLLAHAGLKNIQILCKPIQKHIALSKASFSMLDCFLSPTFIAIGRK
jgi:2-polyprenyl-3-methyl-5-hydroxy-6-metoxy-1,4-benzoquinol methylase